MLGHPPVPVSEFAAHVARLKAGDAALFAAEYESIDPGGQFTWDASNMDANKPKNRYANVIAYDHSRVRLQPLDGHPPASDYINANFLDGYCRSNAYIATQARRLSCPGYSPCHRARARASPGPKRILPVGTSSGIWLSPEGHADLTRVLEMTHPCKACVDVGWTV